MKKRILSMLLALAMVVTLFAACGTSEAPATTETQGAATETQAAAVEAQAAEEEDIAEIEVRFWTLNTLPNDLQMVEDAINAITEEKINTHVNLNVLNSGSYNEQLNLTMAGNEKLDLMATFPGGPAYFNSMISQNQLMDITDLLPEYAPELLELVPQTWLDGTTVDGKIYSVTSLGDKVAPLAFQCRTDMLEETGIDPESIKTVDDLEVLLAKVKELHPEITPVAVGAQKVLCMPYLIDKETGTFIKYDNLGDGDNALIGVYDEFGTDIQNNYLVEDQIYTYQVFKEWYDKGWVYKDGPTYADQAEGLIAADVCFGGFRCNTLGSEASMSLTCDNDMTYIWLDDAPFIGTGLLRKFTWGVPVTATEPEAAVKFMNLMYTDAEVLNLLMWGIEGTHYVVNEDGSISYPEGVDANNSGYYLGDESAIIGNGFLAKTWDIQPLNLREEAYELNMNAQVSKFLGFAFDTTGLENEVSVITNTIAEYRPSLASGLFTQEYYDQFIKKLESDGVNVYLDTIQEQLDAWLAAK